MTKTKNAVSEKPAKSKNEMIETKESKVILKSGSTFIREITKSESRHTNRSLGVLNSFKEYAIYWESNPNVELQKVIAEFRNWVYKDNNFLLPNEIRLQEDSVEMEKLKNSKSAVDKRNHNRLSTSVLPPQRVRDIFSKIQSIPKLIKKGIYKSVRDAESIGQIKTAKAELNKQLRIANDAKSRLNVLGDTYLAKEDSLNRSIAFLYDVNNSVIKFFDADDNAKKKLAKVLMAIEKKVRTSQQDINTYFLEELSKLPADFPRRDSHKDHIDRALERKAIWDSNKVATQLGANKQKNAPKKAAN